MGKRRAVSDPCNWSEHPPGGGMLEYVNGMWRRDTVGVSLPKCVGCPALLQE